MAGNLSAVARRGATPAGVSLRAIADRTVGGGSLPAS